MAETRYLRSDAGPSCTGLTSPLLVSGTIGSSVQTQLLSNGVVWPWTVSEERSFETGAWSVVLRIEAGGPNQAQAQVRVRLEHRNSSCEVVQTLIDVTQGVGTSGTADITYTGDSVTA